MARIPQTQARPCRNHGPQGCQFPGDSRLPLLHLLLLAMMFHVTTPQDEAQRARSAAFSGQRSASSPHDVIAPPPKKKLPWTLSHILCGMQNQNMADQN
mmetsp:Transcript_52941/g.94447  ORF Transcript_52941/g.94447 Transcript_52941/m.94447 type:complete len:99 (-) Transcript_52941:1105-1401(-)